ncbi:MAG TPA: pseudouridine synthase [Syntrophales bacterium]|nr:rRNA pseudouridine synthase [Syntrophobacterales bacterium]HRR41842.1 pseudouridine synthase [Syntrophales bacterium]HRT69930.1 pseudouridine synthase [Syntrophales bacterium]
MSERLQKIIARAGVASRRAAEKMILEGRVSVNGVVVTELGTKADTEKDEIRVDGKAITTDVTKVYLVLNKPAGFVTTLSDPEGRPTVVDLLQGVTERVYPVGRLDYDSEGLLLLTNDGEFALRVQHPRYGIPRTYLVKVRGVLKQSEVKKIQDGVMLEDGVFVPLDVKVEKQNPLSTWLRMTIADGRNRVIRRLFDILGHPVARLVRVSIGGVELGGLKERECRHLKKREIEQLLRYVSRERKTGRKRRPVDG